MLSNKNKLLDKGCVYILVTKILHPLLSIVKLPFTSKKLLEYKLNNVVFALFYKV